MITINKICRDVDEMIDVLDVGVTDEIAEEIIDVIHDYVDEIEDFVAEDEKITDEKMDKIIEMVDRMILDVTMVLTKKDREL